MWNEFCIVNSYEKLTEISDYKVWCNSCFFIQSIYLAFTVLHCLQVDQNRLTQRSTTRWSCHYMCDTIKTLNRLENQNVPTDRV